MWLPDVSGFVQTEFLIASDWRQSAEMILDTYMNFRYATDCKILLQNYFIDFRDRNERIVLCLLKALLLLLLLLSRLLLLLLARHGTAKVRLQMQPQSAKISISEQREIIGGGFRGCSDAPSPHGRKFRA